MSVVYKEIFVSVAVFFTIYMNVDVKDVVRRGDDTIEKGEGCLKRLSCRISSKSIANKVRSKQHDDVSLGPKKLTSRT